MDERPGLVYLDAGVVVAPEHLEQVLIVGHLRVVVHINSLGEVTLKYSGNEK